MWYVYILQCSDKSLYTGITQNLDRRLDEHVSGKGAGHTRIRQGARLIYREIYEDRVAARQREAQVKRWSRAKKLALADHAIGRLKTLSHQTPPRQAPNPQLRSLNEQEA